MNLSLRYIYYKLLKQDPSAHIIDEHAWRLKIQWLTINGSPFDGREGFLFFVNNASFVPVRSDARAAFGLVVTAALADHYQGIPRIVVADDCDIASIFDFAVHEVDKYRTWYDAVRELLLTNVSLQKILDVTFELVPRPMYIADPCWRMLAHIDADMHEMSAIWHQQIQHGYLPIDTVEKLNRTGEYSLITNSTRAFFVHTKVFSIEFIAKTIKHHGRFLGYLFILDPWRDLSPCEIEVAEHLGKLLSSVLGTREQYVADIGGYHDNLVSAVLEKGGEDPQAAIRTILATTGWRKKSDYRLAIVRYTTAELQNSMTRMRLIGLLCDGYDCYAVTHQDMLVVIYHNSEITPEDFMNHLDRCARRLGQQIAISPRFTEFEMLPHYFEHAEMAAALSRSLTKGEKATIGSDELFPYYLAAQCEDGLPCCFEAEQLHAYDRAHSSDYVRTLYMYLLYGANAVAAAEALFLHRNTMRNRLERIYRIIGNDLSNPIDRLRILVSLNGILHGRNALATALPTR